MKKSKRWLSVILVATMLLVSMQAMFVAGALTVNQVKVAALSDIRYQAGAADKEGLLLSKSGALLDAAIERVKSSDADALLVTGDLTNDGRKASHEYVAKKLAEVEAEGIDVFVIPGEHDIREGGTATAVSRAVFETIYKDFGYSESQQDADSASYVADLGNGFKVVMNDSVAGDGVGQMSRWVIDRAKAETAKGTTVFAATHHPTVSRTSVDKIFIDLLNTIHNAELTLDKAYKIYTDDPAAAAKNLGLVDRTSVPWEKAVALADAGVKYVLSGHGGSLSIAGASTNSGAEFVDIMSGSLVNASSSVRYITLYKAQANMKQQSADVKTDMITSAVGVDNVEEAAHKALKANMPAEVDYAVQTAENVIAYLLPALKPNIQQLVRDLDLATLVPDMAGLFNVLKGTIQDVKNDLAAQYVGPLFDILSNKAKLHNIITDVRSALETMDFNGQDFYSFLTDVFITIQKGDGKAPESVEGFFNALRNKEPELLVGVINSFADAFNPTNLVNLLNEVLDLKFQNKYVVTLSLQVQLRGLLAGPYNLTSGLYTYSLDLWGILDGAIILPNGQKISEVARPLVNDLLLGGENDASTKQTPARFTQNLKKDAEGVVNLLFEFGVGDLIGADVFAQGQKAELFAKTITLTELGDKLNKLIPNADVTSLDKADWQDVHDVLRAYGRFTAEDLAKVNKEFTPATDTEPAVTQLSILQKLANDEFYTAVANDFTVKVNNLPQVEALTLDNANEVRALKAQYDEFFREVKSKLSPLTVAKLHDAVAKIYALETYDGAVEAVINQINAIGTVTVDSEKAIKDTRTCYDALNVRQKKAVTNYQILLDAEQALIIAKENAAVISAVEQKITAIGEVTYTASCKAKINLARSAYDALREELKPGVRNYEVLVSAEARYEELRAAAEDMAVAEPVIAKINAIGKVTLESRRLIETAEAAYNALTPAQQKLVTNYDVLQAARAEYDALAAQEQGNQAAANAVIEKIQAIGTVTLDSGNAISAARTAYDALTAEQKVLVINYSALTNAEKAYAELLKQAADKAAAEKVEAKINAIGEVTVEKESLINAARDAYNALTTEQKRLVSNLDVLIAAESRLSILKNDFLFEDGKTGITLRAGSGVVPLNTVMNVTAVTSGTIYNAVAKNYKAVRLYKIELLSDGKSVAPAKSVEISIPQFVFDSDAFAVDANGKMTALNASEQNGSLCFTSASVGYFAVAQPKSDLNTTALENAVKSFEALNKSDYTDVSYAEAKAAYDEAKATLSSDLAATTENQKKVDSAAQTLTDSIALLEFKGADLIGLYAEMLKAKALLKNDYNDFTAVEAALNEAEAFVAVNRDIRDQAKIAELTNNLKKAMGELTFAPADVSPIDDAINSIPKDLQNYTPETVEALQNAKKAAEDVKKSVTRDNIAWQSDVEKAARAVREAIAGLQRKDVAYADVSYLRAAVEISALYNPEDYTDFADVETALAIAESLLAENPSSGRQAEVDSAANAIYNAIGSLTWA